MITPAPWKIGSDRATVIGPNGNVIAECCGYSEKANDAAQKSQGAREDNARLISAAPDLLAACKAVLREITEKDGSAPPCVRLWGTVVALAVEKAESK